MEKTVTAILVAAGSSRRMGFNKLAYCWQGKTVLQRSVEVFERHPRITELVIVTGPDESLARQAAAECIKPVHVVPGGQTRAQSVRAGAAAATGEVLAIHDAARPFVSETIITQAVQAAEQWGAAAPAVPVKDTIKMARDGLVTATPNRADLFAMQTPQCFLREVYETALQRVGQADVTDDCQLAEQAGFSVHLTEGSYENRKITTPDDLEGTRQMRIGHGYDVHRLVEGRKLILGGVEVPFEKGLLGHSDADVLSHAVMDALLGALALGDIGQHFPDNDPAYAGADSLALMHRVAELVRQKGARVCNVDATLLCQAPKLARYLPAMRQNLADTLGLAVEQVSVKATTEEHLGFTGEGLGIAAHAVTLVEE